MPTERTQPGSRERRGVTPTARAAPGAVASLAGLVVLGLLCAVVLVGLDYLDSRQLDRSMIIAALLFVGGTLFIGHRTLTRVRGIAAVSDAVRTAAEHQADWSELRVNPAFGVAAEAWNVVAAKRIAERADVLDPQADPAAGQDLLNAVPHCVVGVDRNAEVVLANSAVAVLTPGDGPLTASALGELIGGEAWAGLKEAVSGSSSRRRAFEHVAAGGGAQALRIVVTPVRIGSICAVLLIEDVTRQRAAEASRGEFVAQATHELRAPLTNIRLYVDEAIDAGPEDEGVREQAVSVIASETQRLERIVADLLSISELESGAREAYRGDVRLDQMLEDTRRAFERSAEEKQIALSFETPPNIPVIQGDRDHVAMLLQNLVGNAIKYTPSGGSVSVRVAAEANACVIDVVDTGIGIAQDEARLVFEKFFRSGDDRVRDIDGSGLGLAFAREVARQHGGDITLDSELNRGSTFTLKLPAGRAA
ncbi:MAG: HAMP domain-containing sensor histidine kinase [Planctomycetota bacterium]